MSLSELATGKLAIVKKVMFQAEGQELATRLEAMGIIPNKPIRVLRKAWLGGPLHIRVGSTTELAIRRREAEKVLVSLETD
jgi:ferrous iron transport protein A